jgi:hypothetical protein
MDLAEKIIFTRNKTTEKTYVNIIHNSSRSRVINNVQRRSNKRQLAVHVVQPLDDWRQARFAVGGGVCQLLERCLQRFAMRGCARC